MTENRFNYTSRYFAFQMGRLKTCTAFSVIFALLGFPLICLAAGLTENVKNFDDELAIPMVLLGVVCILGTCAMSYITPIISYKHLYTKTYADNILSLPLTANQRFLCDTGAVYLSYALPYLLSCGLSALVQVLLPVNNTGLDVIPEYAFKGFFILIMFSALNTAIITCSGRISEAILYPIAINIVMPIITICGADAAYSDCFGIVNVEYDIFHSPFVLMWPFGNFIGIFASETSYPEVYGIIMTVLYLAAAFLGYKKRRAENIGKPFVFRYSYLLTSSAVAVALVFEYTVMFDYEPLEGNVAMLIVLAIILFILMLIMEIINYKKIHSVLKFLGRYAVIFMGGLLACALLIKSEGFGAAYYIPAENMISRVEVESHQYDNYSSSNNYITAVTADTINAVREEHKNLIEKHNEDYSKENFYLTYYLKNGDIITREYFPTENNEISEGFWEKMYSSVDYRIQDTELAFDWAKPVVQLQNQHSNQVYIQSEITDLDALMEALKADLAADNDYGRHKDAPLGILRIGYNPKDRAENEYAISAHAVSYSYVSNFDEIESFIIYESYRNTIDFLNQYGTVPTLDEAVNDSVKNSKVFMLYRSKKSDTNQPVLNNYNHNDAAAVFITEEEFRNLLGSQASYVKDNGQDYVYHITRGIWNDLDLYNANFNFTSGLLQIGYQLDDYSFLYDTDIMYQDNYQGNMLSEEVSDYCDSLFDERLNYYYSY